MENKTIALDFDGVIHSYKRGWTGVIPEDPPNPGTHEALKKLIDEGFILKIYSVRDGGAIHDYLYKWDLDQFITEICNAKPPAIAYIDDKGIRFNDWTQALNDLKRFK